MPDPCLHRVNRLRQAGDSVWVICADCQQAFSLAPILGWDDPAVNTARRIIELAKAFEDRPGAPILPLADYLPEGVSLADCIPRRMDSDEEGPDAKWGRPSSRRAA